MFEMQGLVLIVLLAVAGPLIGFHLCNRYGTDPLSVTFSLMIIFGDWYVLYMWTQGALAYFERWNRDDEPRRVAEPKSDGWTPVLRDLNTGKPVYQSSTPKLVIDLETSRMKRFSRTLLTQRANGFKIDLREKTWEGQFGGRKNYVRVRDVRMAGAFAKENPDLINSPFVVAGDPGWRVVEAGANGRL